MRTLAILLLLTTAAHADSYTSKKDSLGYTHYSGKNFTGLSKTDSLGYTHSEFNRNGHRTQCTSKTDTLGYTHTDCR